MHWMLRRGRKTSLQHVVLLLESVWGNVWRGGGWFRGVRVGVVEGLGGVRGSHFEPLRVYSTVGSSTH